MSSPDSTDSSGRNPLSLTNNNSTFVIGEAESDDSNNRHTNNLSGNNPTSNTKRTGKSGNSSSSSSGIDLNKIDTEGRGGLTKRLSPSAKEMINMITGGSAGNYSGSSSSSKTPSQKETSYTTSTTKSMARLSPRANTTNNALAIVKTRRTLNDLDTLLHAAKNKANTTIAANQQNRRNNSKKQDISEGRSFSKESGSKNQKIPNQPGGKNNPGGRNKHNNGSMNNASNSDDIMIATSPADADDGVLSDEGDIRGTNVMNDIVSNQSDITSDTMTGDDGLSYLKQEETQKKRAEKRSGGGIGCFRSTRKNSHEMVVGKYDLQSGDVLESGDLVDRDISTGDVSNRDTSDISPSSGILRRTSADGRAWQQFQSGGAKFPNDDQLGTTDCSTTELQTNDETTYYADGTTVADKSSPTDLKFKVSVDDFVIELDEEERREEGEASRNDNRANDQDRSVPAESNEGRRADLIIPMAGIENDLQKLHTDQKNKAASNSMPNDQSNGPNPPTSNDTTIQKGLNDSNQNTHVISEGDSSKEDNAWAQLQKTVNKYLNLMNTSSEEMNERRRRAEQKEREMHKLTRDWAVQKTLLLNQCGEENIMLSEEYYAKEAELLKSKSRTQALSKKFALTEEKLRRVNFNMMNGEFLTKEKLNRVMNTTNSPDDTKIETSRHFDTKIKQEKGFLDNHDTLNRNNFSSPDIISRGKHLMLVQESPGSKEGSVPQEISKSRLDARTDALLSSPESMKAKEKKLRDSLVLIEGNLAAQVAISARLQQELSGLMTKQNKTAIPKAGPFFIAYRSLTEKWREIKREKVEHAQKALYYKKKYTEAIDMLEKISIEEHRKRGD